MGTKGPSRFERLAREYLRFYFPEETVVYNFRPDFLKNADTGKNLEIDVYFPFLRIGVEVNSIFHETKLGRARDLFKIKQCRENRIALFQVWTPWQLLNLRHRLRDHFPHEASLNRPLPQNEYLEIIRYQPKQTKAGRAVKYAISNEKAYDAQQRETDGVATRRRVRAMSRV